MSCCLLTALETCITLGVANVLTSGGESTAEKGTYVPVVRFCAAKRVVNAARMPESSLNPKYTDCFQINLPMSKHLGHFAGRLVLTTVFFRGNGFFVIGTFKIEGFQVLGGKLADRPVRGRGGGAEKLVPLL